MEKDHRSDGAPRLPQRCCVLLLQESSVAKEDMTRGMTVGILVVADGNDTVGFAVVIEEEIILPSLSDFPTAVALMMGLLYALNIDYPKDTRYTFEVIQKVLMDIGGGHSTALVHGLRNRLLRKTM
ncbi:hypothetical protein AALO_G00180950 [Alosa alosa]|uniref:Uncharacterized protein n=1 Tax=Alosa alosa TaxID=278164 RepID=A0AAV6GDD0_9TELE|nr:hypothetical protein AALO_G00180950 [Alosa alosa]